MTGEATTAGQVRRRDLRRQQAHTPTVAPHPSDLDTAPISTSAVTAASASTAPLSPRRAAMAAEARAAAGSPRRAAMAKEARESGSAFTAQSGRRGSDGALLRSVRRKRATTVTTLSGLSVAGAAVATVMFATAGNGSEVTVDTSAGSEPRQINAESVNADIPADENSSIEVGAPSAKQQGAKAASRSIAKSALPGCDAETEFGSGASNGQLPDEWLCDLGKGGHKLRADAAVSFAEMNAAYKKETGKEIPITDSYRSLEGQVSVAGRKPGLSARPGTSMHGWGIALDLGGGTESKTGPWDWLVKNAGKFGWENPDWAKSSKYEPWHWEYVPARDQIKGK
ncbi:D-alanyl-D-alanine carboxypeptidase [Brevibacterium casei]|uniref:D-alanyl-D-alanine carboxypeptidase n=1 Tax=Brevibacterium casei TaxID=33889 RepID=A0A269ZG35_9MICO|nr:M15 family metallopeptidase [Brevibacterium casei]PAK96743.1 D-alanyl-D-alanine carboxypeptidase [Brevibacterium casei]